MDKTETYKNLVGSVVRYLLAGLIAWLVQKGVITQDQGEFLLLEAAAIIFAGVLLLWAWIKNHNQTALVNAALVSSPSVSTEQLKERAKNL
jgi:hypothetical protein